MMGNQNKNKEFLERLRATFRIEADEHIKALTSGFIQLEKTRDTHEQEQIIETIYREVHNLKGAARSVDFSAVESICQALEGVLKKFKHSGFSQQTGVFDALHQAVDIIDKLNNAGTLIPIETDEIPNIVERLAELEQISPFILTFENIEPEKTRAGTGADTDDKDKSKKNREEILAAVEARRQQKKQDDTYTTYSENIPHVSHAPFANGTVRISTTKLDDVLRQAEGLIYGKLSFNRLAGDLRKIHEELGSWRKKTHTITPDSIKNLEGKLWEISRNLENDRRSLDTLIDTHLHDTKELLMLPFSTITEGFSKIVWDLARDKKKKVDLIIEGGEIEIDKHVLEGVKVPLLHLLRNAVDHGIEIPEERIRKNKPVVGTIRMIINRAENNKLKIYFSDDGAGIDPGNIKAQSISSGLITAEKLQKLTNQGILDIIFRSEFSTAPSSSEISGRGLGLSIARETLEKLGGTISVTTEIDKGTSFEIMLPLTLGAFRGVLIKTRDAKFIIPILDIDRTLMVRTADIKTLENRETILIDGRAVAHAALAEVLKLPRKPAAEKIPEFTQIVLLSAEGIQMAFSVDEVLEKEDVLVKNLGRQLRRVINISGAVILGSTEVVPILNVSDLIKSAIKMSGGPTGRKEKIKAPKPRSVLLVEDSPTSRMLLKHIMESAGYHVTTAADGETAWPLLQKEPFDIVVSDIDMPRMDGFELTAKIRADKKLTALPVVLVTGLETQSDREKGIEVGANAYIVKSSFDQGNLLAVMKKIF